MLRIVHAHQRAGPRQVVVVQPREPEAQRSGAQHRGPGAALERRQRPHRVVGAEQGAEAPLVQPPVAPGVDQAPVVRAHREVEEQRVHPGEVEVDHAAQPALLEERVVAELRPLVDEATRALLERELAEAARYRFPDLPRGPVHADLFRDNALFEGERLTGVIDFYFAGVDAFLLDVAVCANDWCLVDLQADPRLDEQRTLALLESYSRLRPLQPAERGAWPVLLRRAALRFWLSRLFDYHLPRPGQLVRVHDPEHFRKVLIARRGSQAVWQA